ncbi:type-F conjugative transfer system secretin TraK [Sphingomonas sp. SUN039]|uniref:type-F conjugative transfer system secretin TraK n=1 Tax=Sphingomonas sp. SUN039 TaxID=2937787 RepID=UPI0021644073|nr:type-F conjugative transfer system secretin TraK [Sphingomonas sp. SUN039]UVO53801.1 type-F conjugative transfer system secretin TraK [Sphingomonas sp. SUN039]
MNALLCGCGLACGTILCSRPFDLGGRYVGAGLMALSLLALATPAFADQTVMASDNARVDCIASSRDLTRISLVGDEIASVSKLQTGNPNEDFAVVNEPVRGDIYVSVPEGFAPKTLSFFATSKKGYVYKFACRLAGAEAQQVFVANPAIAGDKPDETRIAAVPDPQEQAVRLVQAMYTSTIPDGYRMRQPVLAAVHVGALKVQMIAEYRSATLIGKVIRIENTGKAAVAITEKVVAPSNAVAITIAEPTLAPGAATTAYIVLPAGASQ